MKKLRKAFCALPLDCYCEILLCYSEWKDYFAFCRVNKWTLECLENKVHWYSCQHVVFYVKDTPNKVLEYVRRLLVSCLHPLDLTELWKYFPKLVELKITGTCMSEAIIHALTSKCSALETFILRGWDLISDDDLIALVNGCKSLRNIDLSETYYVGDTGIEALVSGCRKLISIKVESDAVTDLGIRAIGKHCPKLRILDIDGFSEISDEGILAIANGCPELTKLILPSSEYITDEGLIALARGCKQLISFDISNQCVTDKGIKALAEGCVRLKRVDLEHCGEMTIEGVRSLLSGCKQLEWINIAECDSIKQKELDKLWEENPISTNKVHWVL